jgi:UDP-N-acetylglucosamine--N-acetylmuramyl-(pentapeptide) pyrophosphoryl-undecaprenol N-acetylglucosamine transferase
MALVNKQAALLVKDNQSLNTLIDTAIALINNTSQQVTLTNNISQMAFQNSANVIALEVLKLANYTL